MTLDIGACMDYLVELEKTLAIDSPVELATAEAVRYTLDAGIPDSPFWMNTWTLRTMRESAGTREANFTVTMDCYVEDADPDQASRIATAFWQALMDVLPRHTTLGGNCQLAEIIQQPRSSLHVARGVSGRILMGATVTLDVLIQDFPTYG